MGSIKDLIYFDFEKVKSISSQLTGGLINTITREFGDENIKDGSIGINFQVLKAGTGGKSTEKSLRTEKIELYHEILNQLEVELESKKLLTDINETFLNGNKSFNDFTLDLPDFSFIKATGWSKFEDFDKLKLISSNFNDIQRFINHSNLEGNSELQHLKEQINDKKIEVKKNKNATSKDYILLSAMEKKLDKLSNATYFDESWIERMNIFLDTFSPHRLNLRLLPFDQFTNFQILASLNEKFLTIESYERLIYNYGSRPNIKLSVLGIITSCPREDEIRIHPDNEFDFLEDDQLKDTQIFEKAFRNLFSTFENLEKFFFIPSYPKIGIYPLAIYREIKY